MGRLFDGTNDKLESADGGITGLNATQKSIYFWTTRAADPAGNQALLNGLTATGAGNGRFFCQAQIPTTAGWRPRFVADWTTDGNWSATNDVTNAPHHVGYTYDRGLAINNPAMYVDGVSVGVTTNVAPIGTAATGEDMLRMGENAAGAEDLAANLQHVGIYVGQLFSAAQMNMAKYWGWAGGGALAYYPLLTDKLTDDGSSGATLTATGTTVVPIVTPVQRPSMAGMRLGSGW